MDLTILKLGGSIITRKYEGGEFDEATANRLAKEITQALTKSPQQLILIHGAGGKVHQLAHDFNLQTGAKTQEQIDGSIKTRLAVSELTGQISSTLINHQLPIISFPTSSMFIIQNGQAEVVGIELIKQALKLGLIPLLSGDMVLDDQNNFSIFSGDKVAAILAKKFNATKIIFASDVDGLFDSDPKTNPEAKLIEQINISEIDTTSSAKSSLDTTNQMLGKISALAKEANNVPVQILNGTVANRLEQALTKQSVIGTIIE